MKPHILSLVSDLSTLSVGARRITDRLTNRHGAAAVAASDAAQPHLDPDSVELLKELAQRIVQMERRCRDLSEALEDANDLTLTDTQIADFREGIYARLKDSNSQMLAQAYDVEYFQTQPRALRSSIADTLIRIFTDRNRTPLELWERLSLNGGVL